MRWLGCTAGSDHRNATILSWGVATRHSWVVTDELIMTPVGLGRPQADLGAMRVCADAERMVLEFWTLTGLLVRQ